MASYKIQATPRIGVLRDGAGIANAANAYSFAIWDFPLKQAPTGLPQAQAILPQFQKMVGGYAAPTQVWYTLNNNSISELITPAISLSLDPNELKNFSQSPDLPAYPFIIVHNDQKQKPNNVTGYSIDFEANNGYTTNIVAGIRILIAYSALWLRNDNLVGNTNFFNLVNDRCLNAVKDASTYTDRAAVYWQPYDIYDNPLATPRNSPGGADNSNLPSNFNKSGPVNKPRYIDQPGILYAGYLDGTVKPYSGFITGEGEVLGPTFRSTILNLIKHANDPINTPATEIQIDTLRGFAERYLKQCTKTKLSNINYSLTNRPLGTSDGQIKFWFQPSGSLNIPNGIKDFKTIRDVRLDSNKVSAVTILDDTESPIQRTFTFAGRVVADSNNYNPNDPTTHIGIPGALFFYRRFTDQSIVDLAAKERIPSIDDLTLIDSGSSSTFIDPSDPTQVSKLQQRLNNLQDTNNNSPINFDDGGTNNNSSGIYIDYESIISNFSDPLINPLYNNQALFEATSKNYTTIEEFKEDWVLINGTSDLEGNFIFDGLPNQFVDTGNTTIDANGNTVPIYVEKNEVLIIASEAAPRVFGPDYDDGRDVDITQRGLGEVLYPLNTNIVGNITVIGNIDDNAISDEDKTNPSLVGGCVYDEVTRLPIVGAEVTFGRFRGAAEKLKLRRGPYQRITPQDTSPNAFDNNEECEIISRDEYQTILQNYRQLPIDSQVSTNNPKNNYKQLTTKEARDLDMYPVRTGEDGCFQIEIYNPLDIIIAKAAPIISKDGQSYNIFQPQSLQDLKDIKRRNKALDLLYNQESNKNIILEDEKDLKSEIDRIEEGIYVDRDNPNKELSKEQYDLEVASFIERQNTNQSTLNQLKEELIEIQSELNSPAQAGVTPLFTTADRASKQTELTDLINLIGIDPRKKYRLLNENEKLQRISKVEDNIVKLYENFDASTFLDNVYNAGNTTINQRRQLAVNNINSILQGNPLFTATITGSAGNLIDINTPNTLGAGFNAQFGGIAPVTTDSFIGTSLTDLTGVLGNKLQEKNQRLDEILREPLLKAGEYYGVAKDIVTKGLGASDVLNRVGGELGNKLATIQNGIGKLGNSKIIIRSKKEQTSVSGSAEDIQQAQEIYNSKNRYVTKRIDPFDASGAIKQDLGDIFMRPRFLAYKINYRQLQYPELFPQLGVAQEKLVNAGKKLQAIRGGLANFRELDKTKRRELIKQKIKRDILPSLIESVLIPLGVIGIDTLLSEPLDNLQQKTAERREQLSEFCPKEKVLKDIIRLNNGLKKTVNGLQKAINTANDLVLSGQTLITVTQAAIEIGLFTPYIIAPFSPDIPTKITGDKIQGFRQKLAKGQLITTDLLKWLIQVGAYLNVFVRLTQLADQLIARCMEEIQQALPENVPIDPDLIALNEIIDNQVSSFEQPTDYGSDFIFEIQTDNISFDIPRRRAVAKNQQGVILLTGEYSFTSTTDILIEELKYYIKVNNLKAD